MALEVHKLTENGIFESPHGDYKSAFDPYMKMGEFMRHVLTEKHPQSSLTEIKTGRKITFSRLFEVAKDIADQMFDAGIQKGTNLHLVAESDLDCPGVLIASYLNGYIVGASSPFSPWPEFKRNMTTHCATVLVMSREVYTR